MADSKKPLRGSQVIKNEDKLLKSRREKLFGKDAANTLDETRFGIALSGGGIRSATINLGFLNTLNKFGVLKRGDYLSSVSGGGYTASYIQGTLRDTGGYKHLFADGHIDYMRSRGEYLFPGKGATKLWNQFLLVVGYIVSLVMSWISPLIIVFLGFGIYLFISELIDFDGAGIKDNISFLFYYGSITIIALSVLHFIFNVVFNFHLKVSSLFTNAESAIFGLGFFATVIAVLLGINNLNTPNVSSLLPYLGVGVLLIILGLFTNPNSTSFHRFYRKQLSDAYLHFSGPYKNAALKDLYGGTAEKEGTDILAPYPLINTCLNLQSTKEEFAGTKTNDYFLLSPLYCGAKLTGYVSTKDNPGYKTMTLPAAVTISAAAVNPGMGIYSNKIMSLLTTLLNLRLGYWTWNPLKTSGKHSLIWWPLYFFYELLSKIGLDNKALNISDGGHIENLAVYELLRRKCRLIVAVDAGADPSFTFADLENLSIRARNELGLDIRFREGHIPEEVIRPKPSHGYSEQRYAIADIYQVWDKVFKGGKRVLEHYKNKKVGTFIYVKSSVTAPQGSPEISRTNELQYGTYKYKIYHPAFPHEPTSDQFFDPIQWESYYQLGQHIGYEVLGIDNVEETKERELSIEGLLDWFGEQRIPLFDESYIPEEVAEEAAEEAEVTDRGLDRDIPEEQQYEGEVIKKEVQYKM